MAGSRLTVISGTNLWIASKIICATSNQKEKRRGKMAMAKSEAKQVGEFEFVISRVF